MHVKKEWEKKNTTQEQKIYTKTDALKKNTRIFKD